MTVREFLFGPAPTITPSDAGRALSAPRRAADRARIAERTAQLRAEIAAGRVATLGWRA